MTSTVVSPRYIHHPLANQTTATDIDKTVGLEERLFSTNTSRSDMTLERPTSSDSSSRDSTPAHGAQPPVTSALPPYSTTLYPHGAHPTQAQQAYYNQWAQYCQQWVNYYHHTAQAGGSQYPLQPSAPGYQGGFMPNQQTYAAPSSYLSTEAQYAINRKLKTRSNTRIRSFTPSTNRAQRFEQTRNMSSVPQTEGTAGANTQIDRPDKHKDPKIMLPAPHPSIEYLLQASLQPVVFDPPDRKLVILDLNGTLLYRPNPRQQPTRMVGRPFLQQFLAYLFENFAVMIWSSARPQNVKILVENGLKDYQSQLVASWARDTLGLSPQHYSQNVQCYKDLNRIWASNEVQRKMTGHEGGKRFDQRNTILIDDSALKAAAQPHNLVEIPEFKGFASLDDMQQDVLGEVTGYLELLKMQEDVSKFIFRMPFKADGTWSFDWEHLAPEVGHQGTASGNLQPVLLGDK